MDDLELEAHLRTAGPRLAVPVGLADHGTRILTEARARRGRRLRSWGAGVAASVLLLGGSSVAMAAGGGETPWGWWADNVFSIAQSDAPTCFSGWQVVPEGVESDDPLMLDARDIISGIDIPSLDTSAVEAAVRAENAQATGSDGTISPIIMSDAEVKQMAVSRVLSETLWKQLADRGHELSAGHEVSLIAQSANC